MLWIKIQTSVEEKNGTSEVLERFVSSTHGFDLLNFSVDSLCIGVGLFVARDIANPIKVFLKHLCNLDHLRHGRLLHVGELEFKIGLRFGEGFAFKGPLELLPQPSSETDFPVRLLNDFEDFIWLFGAIFFILQKCIATAIQFGDSCPFVCGLNANLQLEV